MATQKKTTLGVPTFVRLQPEERERLTVQAEREGRTMSSMIRALVREGLQRRERSVKLEREPG